MFRPILMGSFLVFALLSDLSYGHGLRTAYLEITESEPGAALVTWTVTAADSVTRPRFPAECDLKPTGASQILRGRESFSLRCPHALAGMEVGIVGLGTILTEAVVRVSTHDGTSASGVVQAERPKWVIPGAVAWYLCLIDFARMGFDHILSGYDHLLFLLGLLILVQSPRRIFVTATAFTLAHSLTLSLTVLGLLRVSSQAAEAAIALSLVLVALDMAKQPSAGKEGAFMAFVFGLVHGLGFAGALAEIGIPKQSVATSLLGFNLGVEIGQLFFLALGCLVLEWGKRRRLGTAFAQSAAYLVGGMGMFWFLERVGALLGSMS